MNDCNGPCLRHCYCSKDVMLLSNISLVYMLSCFMYLLITRCYFTPFFNSLTEKQIKIKRKSSSRRLLVFIISIAVSILLIKCWNPIRFEIKK